MAKRQISRARRKASRASVRPRDLVTLSEYGRHRGITRQAVQKEVGHRLLRSVVVVDRRPFVTSIEAADREWKTNASRPVAVEDSGLTSAQRDVAIERARYLRLISDVRQGKLIDADEAARAAFDFSRSIREQCLNIPARIAAELAAESDAHRIFIRLDEEIRLALKATAQAMVS